MASVPAETITRIVEVSARYNLAPTDFRLLLYLALRQEGRVCGSMSDLAEEMGIPIRTLRRCAARLAALNLIRREPGRGRIPTCLCLTDNLLPACDPRPESHAPQPGSNDQEGPDSTAIDILAQAIRQVVPSLPMSAAQSLARSELYAPLAHFVTALIRARQARVTRVPPGRAVLHAILRQHLAELENQP